MIGVKQQSTLGGEGQAT